MTKPSLLIFIEHYLPGYKFGGPIRSVANLVSLLSVHYTIYLVTRDRDQNDPQPYAEVVVGKWVTKDSHQILYLPPNQISLLSMWRLVHERTYDYIYTNSLFSRFTRYLLPIASLTARRLTIAPRGELHEGALRLKAYKKRPYVQLVRLIPNQLLVWHATDQQEVDAIRRTFVQHRVAFAPIRFAPDMPGSLTERTQWTKEVGTVRLLSLARIARNKGLKFLLECLPTVTSGHIVLDIYGPIVDQRYWNDCQQLIAAMPAAHRVTYRGELAHDQVGTTMQAYDWLAMPTHGENFGHVIFEALSSGLPVLISDQTPWQQLAATNAGWDLPLQTNAWVDTLTHCLTLSRTAYGPLVAGARQTARNYVDREPFEASYLHLFSQ